jgi:aminoglycoside phosphotransferase (APT) family kinase protein
MGAPGTGETLRWLPEASVDALREALAEVAPDLARRPIVLNVRLQANDPRYFQGSAVVDGAFVVKFAWSELAARRVVHQSNVLRALGIASQLRVPEVFATSVDPALLVTRRVSGEPLTFQAAGSLLGDRRDRLVGELARFLSELHDPDTLTTVTEKVVALPPPEPQADTESLRTRFTLLVEPRQIGLVRRWCDWVDEVLALPSEAVLLHGDLHGYNLVWDPLTGELRLVTDFEWAALGDPAYDFRYVPAQAPTVELFVDAAAAYERICARYLERERVMAWHIRTALGDALWRTEANVPLPGGGTPSSWVGELSVRMDELECGPQ